MEKKPARRHHVVSEFYLRGFADESGRIIRHPKAASAVSVPIGIGDAVRKDFYRVDVDGVAPDYFETAMGELEGVTAPAFKRVIEGNAPMTNDDRYLIAAWAALHHLRSESTRRAGEQIHRAISRLQAGVATTGQIRQRLGLASDEPDERVEEIRARLLAAVDTMPVDHHTHLQLIAEQLPGFTNFVFFRHPWIVMRYTRKTLATSDTPVALMASTEDRETGIGPSLGAAAGLFIPISRRIGLHMGDLPPLDHELVQPVERGGSTALALWSNPTTLWNARQVLYYHPADTPLAGLDNPGEGLDEIDVPDTDDVIRGFASQQGRASGLKDDPLLP